METNEDEKSKLREIIAKLIENDKEWFKKKSIIVGNKPPYWILNYIGDRNEYNRLARGLVIQRPAHGWKGDPLTLIRSFPFIRFFNHQEKEADPVDFSNADMLEKLDGTFVGIFFPENDITKPEFHTRKMLSTHQDDMKMSVTNFHGKEFPMMPIIRSYASKLRFSDRDLPYTYIFEFLHESSYILTQYSENKYGLYLLAARNVETHRELTEGQLDEVAKRLGCGRPRRFDSVNDFDKISKMFKDMAKEYPDFEGFVFRDKHTGKRVKVKDPDYVRKHHLLGKASYANLLVAILNGEEDEIISYFPNLKERAEEVKDMYNKYVQHVVDRVEVWQQTGLTGRDLSVALFGVNPLKNWEIRLKALRGEKVDKSARKESEFVSHAVLRYNKLHGEELRKAIDLDLKERALGQKAVGRGENPFGSPEAVAELIGLKEKSAEGEEL